jgi:uncharacterized low-complexity protein
MSKRFQLSPLSAALSAALVGSTFTASAVIAEENPFQLTEIKSGYIVAESHMGGKSKEGKCGSKMDGKCGMKKMMKKMDTDEDGAISEEEFMSHHEEKFNKMDKNNDGKVTEDEMKMMMKNMHEGKCGEGKCGGKKSES